MITRLDWPRRVAAGSAAALLVVGSPATATDNSQDTAATAQVQPGAQVNGYNVSVVAFDRGSFRQQGDRWIEYDINNRPIFTFEETNRDDWSVYLFDRTRNVRLQLDLHRRKVGYGANGGTVSDLYDIVSASAGRMPDRWSFRDRERFQRNVTRWVNAGPIWNRQDAAVKCPVVAYAVDGRWTGEWRTTRQGQMSVCEIGQ